MPPEHPELLDTLGVAEGGRAIVDHYLRATNLLIAGRNIVVAGYGWVGRGIASRMAGHGGHVTIVEIDPIRALEALMDGFQVMNVAQAAAWGDLFVTATGNVNVFRREHFESMRDGAVMANSGHFDAELDLMALRQMAEPVRLIFIALLLCCRRSLAPPPAFDR